MTAASHSMTGKTCVSGVNVVIVPVRRRAGFHARDGGCSSLRAMARTGPSGLPRWYSCMCTLPSRCTSTRRWLESALTTETPTPCRPPDTLYPRPPNLPPACRIVCTTSSADLPVCFCFSTGMPRPLSLTVMRSSLWMTTSMRSQTPFMASSMELSSTSRTR